MELYAKENGKLIAVKEQPFRLEKEIQQLFEANLAALMQLELVKSEFSIKNKRIDTLAYDPQSKAFIIIEYKRERNLSVVDQGFSYLSLMLENKAEFIVEYNESLHRHLKREEVDWSQTRVVFVSPAFTDNQIQATNFKDIAIELWTVRQYENGTVLILPIKKSNSAESIKPLTQNKESLQKVAAEIKVYSEEEHLSNGSEAIVELYAQFRQAILQLADNIEVRAKKQEIGFFKNGKVFADICIQKGSLKMWINLKKGKLDDPKQLMNDVSAKGHWGNGDYELKIENDEYLEYIMSLVKQAV